MVSMEVSSWPQICSNERCCSMLKGLEQLEDGEERLEEEHVQWHSWIQERTSVQASPSLKSLLRLSLGQLLCWTNPWTSSLGRAFLGILQPSPSSLAFTVSSSRDLKPPKSLFYFLSFSVQSSLWPSWTPFTSCMSKNSPLLPVYKKQG